MPIGGEPLAAPLHDCHVIFLHTTAFLVNVQYHRKQEIATGKGGIFAGKQLFRIMLILFGIIWLILFGIVVIMFLTKCNGGVPV